MVIKARQEKKQTKRTGDLKTKVRVKTIILLCVDRPSTLPSSLPIYSSVSLQVSFNNGMPGEGLNSTVEQSITSREDK